MYLDCSVAGNAEVIQGSREVSCLFSFYPAGFPSPSC